MVQKIDKEIKRMENEVWKLFGFESVSKLNESTLVEK